MEIPAVDRAEGDQGTRHRPVHRGRGERALARAARRGKTHLAVASAYRAIQNGFEAHFVTAAELIDDLSAAFRQGRLAEALVPYTHPGLLVVDEVGYLTYGADAANMLFHVVNGRHKRRRAMIFTTNKRLATWGRVLHDEDLALAIVDRILERGQLLTLDGPSLRTKHLGREDPTATDPRLRWPEFPKFARQNFRNPQPTHGRAALRNVPLVAWNGYPSISDEALSSWQWL